MADFDALLEAAHAHGIKVLLDFVPNHTSDRHPWFLESRSSRTGAKRDWYIWRDGAPGGGPPNNWLSEFGGPAWAFDEQTGQYYYHAFLAAQPDLNWRNPGVRAAMHEVMRFWLRKGVDGFRVDVMWHLIKDAAFRDNPPNPDYRAGEPPYRRLLPLYSADRPEVHEVVRGLRAVIDEFPGRVLIGEIYLPLERLVAYYGRDLGGAHLPFNFSLLETPWRAPAIAQAGRSLRGGFAGRRLAELGAGQSRPAAARDAHRAGAGARRRHAAADAARHADALLRRRDRHAPGGDPAGSLRAIRPQRTSPGRDGARTPMQWEASRFAGFSTAEPWLPLAENFAATNVASQRADRGSLFNLYRRLIALRRTRPALTRGAYRPQQAENDVLAFVREEAGDRVLVALNFGTERGRLGLTVSWYRPALVGCRPRRRRSEAFIGFKAPPRGRRRACRLNGPVRPQISEKPRFSSPFALTCATPADTYATLFGRR